MNLQYLEQENFKSSEGKETQKQLNQNSDSTDSDQDNQIKIVDVKKSNYFSGLKRMHKHSSSMIFNHQLNAHHHHPKTSEISHLDITPPRQKLKYMDQMPSKKKQMLTKQDISKMTLSEIKNLPIYEYGKSVYNDALAMVENIEKQERQNVERGLVQSVEVMVKYFSEYGQQLLLTGDLLSLGQWSSKGQGKFIYRGTIFRLSMEWSDSHYWRVEFDKQFLNLNPVFEYKFVVTNGKMITKWEKGENRKFKFSEFIDQIKIARENRPSYISKNSVYQLNMMKQSVGGKDMQITYHPKNKKIVLKHLWKVKD